MLPRSLHIIGIAAALLIAACSGDSSTPTADGSLEEPTATTSTSVEVPATEPSKPTGVEEFVDAATASQATVSGPISGNRLLVGSGNLIDQTAIDIPLDGIPAWVVGVPGADPTFVVTHTDGRLEAWRIRDDGPQQISLGAAPLPSPPLVAADGDDIAVLESPSDASPLTYPVGVAGRLVYVNLTGGLVILDAAGTSVLEIDALLDSRISVSADGLVSVLAEVTDRYPHGVLGDRLEAGRVVVVDPTEAVVVAEGVVPAPTVIEGIAAPWVDADGDGSEEILVTVSNAEVGARLAVFDRNGAVAAEGPPIGRGNRWRNQLGAAPTGPNGEIEVIDVRVPHIGGVVEFFRFEGNELVPYAQQPGYTSHVFGARNLDLALAADVTGDDRVDVVVPNQQLTALGVLSRTNDGVEVVTELPLPGRIVTNLAGAALNDGRLAIAAGTSEGILRIYAAG